MALLTVPKHLEELTAMQHSGGGWGYAPEKSAQLEPTCLALLALSADAAQFGEAISKGRQFLEQSATADGYYRVADGRDEAIWPTSLVLYTLSVLNAPPTALMLIALQGEKHARLDAAVQYLIKEIDTGDLEHRCWIKLALDLYPDQPGVPEALHRLDEAIREAQHARAATPWLRPAVMRQ